VGEPEIEDDGRVVFTDHHVRGLHVAMDDARLVRDVEGARDFRDQEEDVADLGARRRRSVGFSARKARRPRLALDVPHRDVAAAAIEPDVVDGADRRVIEARDDFGLAPKASDGGVERRPDALHDLERDAAIDAAIDGEVNDALAAAPELPDDLVGADFRRGVAFRVRGRVRSVGVGSRRPLRKRIGQRFEIRETSRDRGLGAGERRKVGVEVDGAAFATVLDPLLDESSDEQGFFAFVRGVGHRGFREAEITRLPLLGRPEIHRAADTIPPHDGFERAQ
jgi:hypothetical protein